MREGMGGAPWWMRTPSQPRTAKETAMTAKSRIQMRRMGPPGRVRADPTPAAGSNETEAASRDPENTVKVGYSRRVASD